MKKFFYLLFSTIILISCGNGAKAKTEAQSMEEKQPDHIEVLYFHGAQRCITCRAIETNIVALLDSLYSKEQADDRIIYKVIDISKKENNHLLLYFITLIILLVLIIILIFIKKRQKD